MEILDIINKINSKKDEIAELNEKLIEYAVNKYSYLIGKKYKTAASCVIKITKIISVDTRYKNLTVECISILGGKHYNRGFVIDNDSLRDLSLNEIENGEFNEINDEEYEVFIKDAIDVATNNAKKYLLYLDGNE